MNGMEIIRIAALALTGVLLAALMKSVNRELTIYIILATVVILFVTIIDRLVYVFEFLGNIYDNVAYGKTFFPVILKVLAVAIRQTSQRSSAETPARRR